MCYEIFSCEVHCSLSANLLLTASLSNEDHMLTEKKNIFSSSYTVVFLLPYWLLDKCPHFLFLVFTSFPYAFG